MDQSSITLHLTHSLYKQLPGRPVETEEISHIHALRGETVSVQVIAAMTDAGRAQVDAEVQSPLPFRLRRVMTVPVRLAAYPDSHDDGYLSVEPGLYPDLLADYAPGSRCWVNRLEPLNFWIDFTVPAAQPAGDYPMVFRLHGDESDAAQEIRLTVTVLAAELPPQTLKCTQWFHSDCLADYYHVSVFSPEYWRIIENFMRAAVQSGTNMILTPIFTPALDTAVGGERTTVQLVDVTVHADGTYAFGFDRLLQWVNLAHRVGITDFEMAHLFTQWGAKFCPKIMAHTPQGDRRIFGWADDADGDRYVTFLRAFLPALTVKLREWGIAAHCTFHISDEPSADALPHYLKLREIVLPLIPGFRVMDALSHYGFYEQGAVDIPVAALDAAQPFVDHHVEPLWVYYCCSQGRSHESNRFIAMPSVRNRVLGFQMYLEGVSGFLQWGFNYYNDCCSAHRIDPFLTTDGDGAYPAGDPFLVYPGEGGVPLGSIRQMVFAEAIQDQRACRLLEQKIGRDRVCEMIRSAGIRGFLDYPMDAAALLALRGEINAAIARA